MVEEYQYKKKISRIHQPLFPYIVGMDEVLEREVLKSDLEEGIAVINATVGDTRNFIGMYFFLPNNDVFGVGIDSRMEGEIAENVRATAYTFMKNTLGKEPRIVETDINFTVAPFPTRHD